MKSAFVVLLAMLLNQTAFAAQATSESNKCDSYVIGFAEGSYLAKTTASQGHEYDVAIESRSINQDLGTVDYTVVVQGHDDDYAWNSTFSISVNSNCSLDSYSEK